MSSSDRFVTDGWLEAARPGSDEPRPWQMGEVAEPTVAAPDPIEEVVSPADALEAAIAEAREAGWAEGHQAGIAEGRRSEETRTRSALDAAARAVTEVEARLLRMEEAAQQELPALATAIAAHLVGHAVEADPAVLSRLVQQAVSEFLPDEPVRIRVHPRDLAMLSGPMGARGASEGAVTGRTVRWISDEDVRPGGCLVEGRERLVDGRVSTALERIYRALSGDDA